MLLLCILFVSFEGGFHQVEGSNRGLRILVVVSREVFGRGRTWLLVGAMS